MELEWVISSNIWCVLQKEPREANGNKFVPGMGFKWRADQRRYRVYRIENGITVGCKAQDTAPQYQDGILIGRVCEYVVAKSYLKFCFGIHPRSRSFYNTSSLSCGESSPWIHGGLSSLFAPPRREHMTQNWCCNALVIVLGSRTDTWPKQGQSESLRRDSHLLMLAFEVLCDLVLHDLCSLMPHHPCLTAIVQSSRRSSAISLPVALRTLPSAGDALLLLPTLPGLTQGSPPLGSPLTPLSSYISLCFLCHCPNHTVLPLCVCLPSWPVSFLKAGTRYDPFCVPRAQPEARPRWGLPECLLRVWEVFWVQLIM